MSAIRIFEEQIQPLFSGSNWVSVLKKPADVKSKLENILNLDGFSGNNFNCDSLNSLSLKTTDGGFIHLLMSYTHEVSANLQKGHQNIGLKLKPLGMKRFQVSAHPSMFDAVDFSNSEITVVSKNFEIPLSAYLSRRNITPLFFINHDDLQSSILWMMAHAVTKKEA